MRIVNLTQHDATPAQVEDGVFALSLQGVQELKQLLTFTALPARDEVAARAAAIAALAVQTGAVAAMIGGAPYLMAPLERELQERGIAPLYAYSERRSVETIDPATGEVTKTQVFAHLGFVEA